MNNVGGKSVRANGKTMRPHFNLSCSLTLAWAIFYLCAVRWLRTNTKTAQVSGIAQTGPAALSGLVAGGDEILAIDGKSLSEWAGDGVKLQELTAGEEVYIFLDVLVVCRNRECVRVV